MRAAVYEGPRTVTVKPDPRIDPCDVIVRITSTNICGSDLHMYEGRTSFETGRTLGHEHLGRVAEGGPGVSKSHTSSAARHRRGRTGEPFDTNRSRQCPAAPGRPST